MHCNDRRQFLANVGSGVLVGSLGAGLASDLGISTAFANDGDDRLTFGELEPLVALARVSASEFGTPAPGYVEACELLRIKI